MTEKQFKQAVTKRAEDLVQHRLMMFKAACERAAIEQKLIWHAGGEKELGALLIAYGYSLFGKKCGYPKRLWEEAEKQVLQDVLNVMDPLQRAINAKGGFAEGEPRTTEALKGTTLDDVPF